MTDNQNTEWMGEYRNMVAGLIRLCNVSSTKFCRRKDYHTSIRLSAHEIQIIEYILENEGKKMSDIAKRLGITRGTFSNNVSKLMELGCLEKESRDGNKKDKYIVVTEKGKEIYQAYVSYIYDKSFREVFRLADTIPEQHIQTFCRMLEYFTDSLV